MKLACKIGIIIFLLFSLVQCIPAIEPTIDQPATDLSSKDVVEAQLKALQNNNEPYIDAGIQVVYNFASPYQKAENGPYQKYKNMYNSRRYGTLVDNKHYLIKKHFSNKNKAEYFVFLTDQFDREWVFIFRLSRQKTSPHAGCWMTDNIMAYADARALTGEYYKV